MQLANFPHRRRDLAGLAGVQTITGVTETACRAMGGSYQASYSLMTGPSAYGTCYVVSASTQQSTPAPPVNVNVSPNISTQVSPTVSPVLQQQYQPTNSPLSANTSAAPSQGSAAPIPAPIPVPTPVPAVVAPVAAPAPQVVYVPSSGAAPVSVPQTAAPLPSTSDTSNLDAGPPFANMPVSTPTSMDTSAAAPSVTVPTASTISPWLIGLLGVGLVLMMNKKGA